MKNKKKLDDEKLALRAFVVPQLYPFILEVYLSQGKGEDQLKDDLKLAREYLKKFKD